MTALYPYSSKGTPWLDVYRQVMMKIPTAYAVIVLAGNALITCGIMQLGCVGGAVAAVVAAYASNTLAAMLGGG